MMKRSLLSAACLLFANATSALEVEGVDIPESASVSGESLVLNGAGVRTKFFFDIYVGALFLHSKVTTAEDVLAMPGPKRVTMDFLYSEVPSEKLTAAWDEGFENNLPEKQLAALEERLKKFNGMFENAHEGDTLVFNFLVDGSTSVVYNGKDAGRIAGADFQKALLLVWLGEEPADGDLKEAMLGEI